MRNVISIKYKGHPLITLNNELSYPEIASVLNTHVFGVVACTYVFSLQAIGVP
jgi:hypothetical protein